jgi:hypothetical protein
VQEQESAELRDTLGSIGQLAPVVEALRRQQSALQGYEQAAVISRRILDQYDRLLAGISAFEGMSGRASTADRRAAAEHIISEMRATISGEVQLFGTGADQALIIKTGPNMFRVTFPVPMRVAPTVTFSDLPARVHVTLVELTAIGFTVIFSPTSFQITKFPHFQLDARL